MFSARRKPKRIVSSEPQDDSSSEAAQPQAETDDNEPVVKRPATAPKQKSKLRISFDPAGSESADSTYISRGQNEGRLGASALSRVAPQREERQQDRPTYSKNYLDELKDSTPITPKNEVFANHDNDLAVIQPQTQALDIASKFGSSAAIPSAIPSAAEMAEKKARRERLAKEASASALTTTDRGSGSVRKNDDFVSLDGYDSDGEFKPSRMQVSTYLQKDRADNEMEYTRLVPEDEDIAEGFEQFVEDDAAPGLQSRKNANRITMSMTTDMDNNREAMRKMIDNAEGGADGSEQSADDSEASDASAEHAYMNAQTRHGAGFSHLSKEERRRQEKEAQRPRQPEKTTTIPTLAAGVARLRELKEQALLRKQSSEKRKEEIMRRLTEIQGEKSRIQSALDDLGKQLEEADAKVAEQKNDHGNGVVHRGLDSLGSNTSST